MPVQVTTISCPSCGGKATYGQTECEYCGNSIVITSFQSMSSMLPQNISSHMASCRQALAQNPDDKDLNISTGMCFLSLKQYNFALADFEKAMPLNFDNSEVFFYAAVCLLQGKMPFLHLRPTIDKIISYVESAMMIETRGIYHYFLAYIKHDYFKRKFLNVTPSYTDHLAQARQFSVSEYDIEQLFALLGTQRPAGL